MFPVFARVRTQARHVFAPKWSPSRIWLICEKWSLKNIFLSSRECEYRPRMHSRKKEFPKNVFLHVWVLCRGVLKRIPENRGKCDCMKKILIWCLKWRTATACLKNSKTNLQRQICCKEVMMQKKSFEAFIWKQPQPQKEEILLIWLKRD